MNDDRPLPQNPHLERCVLSCLLQGGAGVVEAIKDLLPNIEVFHTPANRRIFKVIAAMPDVKAIDLVSVAAALEKSGDIEAVGGDEYLAALLSEVPTSANFDTYVAELLAIFQRRQTIQAGYNLAMATEDGFEDTPEILTQAEANIAKIRELTGQRIPTMQEIHRELADNIVSAGNGGLSAIPWGIDGMERVLLLPGSVVVLAARPGQGKTALACTCILGQAKRGIPIGLMCVEMTNAQILARLAAQVSGVAFSEIVNGFPQSSVQGVKAATDAMETVANLPLRLHCGRDFDFARIRQTAKRWVREGVRCIWLDYLQLFEMPRAERHHIAVGKLSRWLKLLANDLRTPFVLLAQLNREAQDGKPKLNQLKDSGSIEQDADAVVLLHRPDPENEKPERYGITTRNAFGVKERREVNMDGRAAAIIAKNRHGPGGVVYLDFDGLAMRFSKARLEATTEEPAF